MDPCQSLSHFYYDYYVLRKTQKMRRLYVALAFVNGNAKKSSVSNTVLTCSRQHLRNKNKEDLAKSIGVVLAKYPPKVKLENFHNSRVPELG